MVATKTHPERILKKYVRKYTNTNENSIMKIDGETPLEISTKHDGNIFRTYQGKKLKRKDEQRYK